MKVAKWIRLYTGRPVTVAANSLLEDAVTRLLVEPVIRDLYVLDEQGALIGHISHDALARHVLAAHRPYTTRREMIERLTDAPVVELMEKHYVSAHPDEDLDEVLSRMIDRKVEDLPVVNTNNEILGAINMRDVLRAFCRDQKGHTPSKE